MGGINIVTGLLCLVCCSWADRIPTTKLYIREVEPELFNWTGRDISEFVEGYSQFVFRASLLNFPDLPSWLHYTDSDRFNHGFLYGSPPNQPHQLQVEVIGLNRKTYETRRRTITISVEANDPAPFSVQLKVDRVSVEEMLLAERHNMLLDVFRRDLWPESAADLHIMFLASAVELGARVPLDPTYGEGVVIEIGSKNNFSQTLLDLQKEIGPLRSKGDNCPDFKHTSVERFFKQHNFYLDWCAFHLLENNSPDKPRLSVPGPVWTGPQVWRPVNKRGLPTRDHASVLGFIMLTSMLGFTMMVIMISFVLCVDRKKAESPTTQRVRYASMQRTGRTLRSLSAQRDTSGSDSSPRRSMERTGLRPNPPPYSGVHHVSRDDYSDDEEAKTWYC